MKNIQEPQNIKEAKNKNLKNKRNHHMQVMGLLNATFNYIFEINLKILETKV